MTSSASLVERARGGAEDAAVRVRRKRPFVDHLVLALSRYQADAGNRLAAAVSYYGFLSFFPLVALAFSITGFVIDAYPEAQQNLIDQINTFLPGLADKLNIASIGNVKVASGIIGIVGLLITGLAWVNALREAMRTMWHHNIQVGNILARWLHDTLILLGLGLALLLTTAVSGAASAGIGLVLDALDLSGSTVATYLLRIVSLLLAVAADTVIYAFLFTRLPRVAVPMRRVLRGALFAAIGLELIKVGAAYLIPQKVSNPIYLTFGVLFGLLIWINVVSRWSLLAAAWTVTEPYDADVAPSGTASVDMAQKAGIPEEYASSDPAAVLTTFGGGVPSPLYGAIQAKSPVAAAEPGFGGGPASGAGPGLPASATAPASPASATAPASPASATAPASPASATLPNDLARSGRVARMRRITPRTGTLLLALAAWTAVTWLDFLRRLVGDREHKTSFYVAHGVLIVANLVMAGVLARIGLRIRRTPASAEGAGAIPGEQQ